MDLTFEDLKRIGDEEILEEVPKDQRYLLTENSDLNSVTNAAIAIIYNTSDLTQNETVEKYDVSRFTITNYSEKLGFEVGNSRAEGHDIDPESLVVEHLDDFYLDFIASSKKRVKEAEAAGLRVALGELTPEEAVKEYALDSRLEDQNPEKRVKKSAREAEAYENILDHWEEDRIKLANKIKHRNQGWSDLNQIQEKLIYGIEENPVIESNPPGRGKFKLDFEYSGHKLAGVGKSVHHYLRAAKELDLDLEHVSKHMNKLKEFHPISEEVDNAFIRAESPALHTSNKRRYADKNELELILDTELKEEDIEKLEEELAYRADRV